MVWKKTRNDLPNLIRIYKKIKCEEIENKPLNIKEYFKTMNVKDCQMRFKIASFMTPTTRMNFQNDKQYAAELWSCPSCKVTDGGDDDDDDSDKPVILDTQQHVVMCEAYSDLRDDKDLSRDKDLVEYFRQVLARRVDGGNVCQ